MNFDMILRMVMRRLVGKAVNAGINAGMGALSGRGKRSSRLETPEEAEIRAEREYRQAVKRARQAKRDRGEL